MEPPPLKPERLAQLEEFARRRGKSTADALDDALADYFEWPLMETFNIRCPTEENRFSLR